jgi:hypothetical protein
VFACGEAHALRRHYNITNEQRNCLLTYNALISRNSFSHLDHRIVIAGYRTEFRGSSGTVNEVPPPGKKKAAGSEHSTNDLRDTMIP